MTSEDSQAELAETIRRLCERTTPMRGPEMRALRRYAGLSQTAFAELMGYKSTEAMSRMETNLNKVPPAIAYCLRMWNHPDMDARFVPWLKGSEEDE